MSKLSLRLSLCATLVTLCLPLGTAWAAGDTTGGQGKDLESAAQAQSQDVGNFLKDMMKTGPKAPDAWCQRHAIQQAHGVARGAAPEGSSALGGANPDACNPGFALQLSACISKHANEGEPRSLSERTRVCLAELSAKGVKAAH